MKYTYTRLMNGFKFEYQPNKADPSERVAFLDYQVLNFLFGLKRDFLLFKEPISTLNLKYLMEIEDKDYRENRFKALLKHNSLNEVIKTRSKEIDEMERNPLLLAKFGSPPITPQIIGERLDIEQCYKALSKKLNQYLEESEALVYVKRSFFSKEWQHKKMHRLEQEKVRKMFDIFFKAHYGVLPDVILEEDPPAYNYLKELSASYSGFPICNLDLDNGDISKNTVFMVLSVATLFTSTALYYLLSQTLDSVERFYYDENWLKASITLASLLAGASLGAYLCFFIITPLLALGAITPIGLAIGAAVLSALVLATITTWLSNVIQNYFFESSHLNALDPADYKRYELDQKQILTLKDNGFNIDIVQCALVALRKELIDLEAESIPTLMSRLISSTPKIKRINEILKSIRALRDGSYTEDTLQVDNMSFNLKEPGLNLKVEHVSREPQFNF